MRGAGADHPFGRDGVVRANRARADRIVPTRTIDNLTRVRIVSAHSISENHSVLRRERPMRAAAVILALIFAVVAVVYLVVPADSLPGFFPGHEAGSARIHLKHGVVSGVVALVLF